MTTALEEQQTDYEFPALGLSGWSVAELVVASQQGDRAAFGELAERYAGMVHQIGLRRLGDWAEAQELCQEVLMKAMQRIHQLKEPEAFGGWLRSIAVRMACNRQTRRRRDGASQPEALDATPCDGASPLDAALAGERADQVRSGLGRLGDLDRRTLVAFYVRGESLAQMSVAFEAPVGTIKRRLHVARKRLADELVMLQAV